MKKEILILDIYNIWSGAIFSSSEAVSGTQFAAFVLGKWMAKDKNLE